MVFFSLKDIVCVHVFIHVTLLVLITLSVDLVVQDTILTCNGIKT
jgi:hypothetical protein